MKLLWAVLSLVASVGCATTPQQPGPCVFLYREIVVKSRSREVTYDWYRCESGDVRVVVRR